MQLLEQSQVVFVGFGGNSVTRNALFLPCSYVKAS
jgi:hypothetical protein